jgi:AraC-like DNA-binding protein
MNEFDNRSESYLDRDLITEVSEGIVFFDSARQRHASYYSCGKLSQYYNRPFFDAEFLYRLKQSLEIYWEDDTLDASDHYQFAEDLINRGSDIHQHISSLPNKRKITRMEILRRVNRAKEILDSNETVQFDLDKLARECTMSKYFFIRSFKNVFHLTPQKYFIRKKLRGAKKLLRDGMSVTLVAKVLGYPDVFTFSKQFKKYEGTPPVLFKRVSEASSSKICQFKKK